LLRELRSSREDRGSTEYLDVAEDVEPQSARIYAFRRGLAARAPEATESS
jgi:hypothetical protein